jgi:hypothetical protein
MFHIFFCLQGEVWVVGPHVQWPSNEQIGHVETEGKGNNSCPLHIRCPFRGLDNLKLKICVAINYKPLMQSPSIATV